jgi:Tol biopolymer transport system component
MLLDNAKDARFSPDGRSIVFVAADSPGGVVVASATGSERRAVATELRDPLHPVWSPDSAYFLVNGRRASDAGREWFVVSRDGTSVRDTGIIERLRARGFNDGWLSVPPAWRTASEIVFSGNTRDGWSLWRQPLVAGEFRAAGDPERLTTGTTMDWWPAAANGRLVFVASHPDVNLWSLPVGADGIVRGRRERFTDGAGLTGFASMSRDGTRVAFTSDRSGNGDVFLKDVASGRETGIATGPERQAYSVISPGGARIAYGVVGQGIIPSRPVYVASIDGQTREVCDDCGRPRDWFDDERRLLIEEFGSTRHAFSALDVDTGSRIDIVTSVDDRIANPRLAPEAPWIAFDATRPGGTPRVVVARVDPQHAATKDAWMVIADGGSNPFWSANGKILYFVSADAGLGTQALILGRHFDPVRGVAQGDSFNAYAVDDLIVPVWTSGSSPVAGPDRILMRLMNLTGEIWQMEPPSGK